MSHTPGPWHQNELSPRAIMGPNGELVGDVLASRCDDDLRLIAAAPDLLSACQDMVVLLGEMTLDGSVLTEAKAAIRKATGEP